MKTMGIIAGNGRFPLLVAEEARKHGYRVAVCAIEKEASAALKDCSDDFEWIKLGELKKLVRFFKGADVDQAVMAGKVEKVRLFQENVRPDLDMMKVLMGVRDFKDDSLLSSIARYLEKNGIKILDSTFLIKDRLPGPGVLGKKKPSKEVMEDIRFGFELARAISALDVGQTVVVKKKAVVAVEAIEGTDQAIQRGGVLSNGDMTVVKVAKPDQDMRFDVPAVGMNTLQALKSAQAAAFAFEAHKTIFIDQKNFIMEADRCGLAVIGVSREDPE